METPWHARPAQTVLARLRTHRDGLAHAEAMRRLRAEGANALPRRASDGWGVLLVRQFASPLMLLLGVASVASVATGDVLDAAVIAAAAGLNAAVAFLQEYKASRALEALRSLVVPTATVRRDGRLRVVTAASLVPGDLLVLHAGDRVGADARLIETVACEADEATLTGESTPVAKRPDPVARGAGIAERASMAFAGTTVVAGSAIAVVVATGVRTELGKIVHLVEGTPEGSTPLQIELRRLSIWIGILASVMAAGLFALGVLSGRPEGEMLKTAIALAVAAVPEGLTLSVTVVLVVGMRRILARGSLVRRLLAAETLGSVSVICTDKTGTLTRGEMAVAEVVPADGEPSSISGERVPFARGIVTLLEAGMLCNDAVVEQAAAGRRVSEGTPTERALMEAGLSAGIDPMALAARHQRRGEIPFDPVRKEMATLHEWGTGRRVILKGAPERVMGQCDTFEGEDGRAHPLTGIKRRQAEAALERMLRDGLRVLAFAASDAPASAASIEEDALSGMRLLGYMGMRDPLREQAREHVLEAARAGVRTVLVTGDHPDTARAIAREARVPVAHALVTGADLDRLDDAELARRVHGISVYARVEPRHKIRIVRAWQSRGDVVAMVGDGVNDAPALKAADIGVALGSGSAVAKETADIVLLDNDLGTITKAVEQGRILFENIRKMCVYLLSDSFTEVMLIGGALLAGLPLPLTPLQILWVNLVADSLPNAALTLEPGEPGVMREPPRRRGTPVLDAPMLKLIFVIGIVTDLALFAVYLTLSGIGLDLAHMRTILFAAVGVDSLLYVFAVKSFRVPIWRTRLSDNPSLLAGVLIGFLLMAAAVFWRPLSGAFGNVPLSAGEAGLVFALGLVKLSGIELAKATFLSRR
ncbi:hypothetical protein A2856_02710 [Candidatus Uhrbacteria bacterium RIFCSPHIGHO2_01_FULL_63_20]|uniref:Cation-transporting P-type ATPase N-terminal domain-containing protein n=1 Tax=Candidatus Uhrbacteria bacterium RIFCSPHIGHO2_01_FULL_63_20 TaxID=1802385 RepID=A0A1F7TKS9_9BACT|nr:MAG: hypothetical protein A2856_02710 [Candidatus Uhrbacteria bacterium RIFCSPHIGHO2_01_FULL_63_20]